MYSEDFSAAVDFLGTGPLLTEIELVSRDLRQRELCHQCGQD